MRIESSVTAISWIPSEAIEGMPKIPFEMGIGHYDEPPPDRIAPGDLARLRDEDRFREANDLRAWIEVEDGKIVGHGHEGAGYVGTTTFKLGPKDLVFQGVAFETLQPDPDVRDDEVRFVQTVGGRAGFPAPGGSRAARSCVSTRRRPGRPWRSRSGRTVPRITSSSEPARFRGTSSTTARASSPRRRGRSTSRPGTERPTASTRPGATRIRSRSSRRPSQPSSASSRPAS